MFIRWRNLITKQQLRKTWPNRCTQFARSPSQCIQLEMPMKDCLIDADFCTTIDQSDLHNRPTSDNVNFQTNSYVITTHSLVGFSSSSIIGWNSSGNPWTVAMLELWEFPDPLVILWGLLNAGLNRGSGVAVFDHETRRAPWNLSDNPITEQLALRSVSATWWMYMTARTNAVTEMK